MERACSSDDDSAWSHASSDNSSSIDEISNMKSKKNYDSESGFASKNYTDKLCSGLEREKQKTKSKKRKSEEDLPKKGDYQSAKKKLIKTEAESDKDKSESEEIAQSDSFVNLRVKKENAPSECDEIRSKKKKQHRKINESELLDNTEENYNTTVDESVAQETNKKKQNKKKIKEKSRNESELDNLEENDTTMMTMYEENVTKKKTKHKKIKEESRNGLELSDNVKENYNTTLHEPVENETKKKKKHKKNKEESIESEILHNTKDDLNEIMNMPVEDETNKKKKKRKFEHNSDLEEEGDRSISIKCFKRIKNIENSDDNEQECDKIDNDIASSTFLENIHQSSKMDIDSTINDVSAITSTVSKKTTRISDRLQFENDEVIDSIINGNELDIDILSTKEVKTFLSSNTSLVPLKSFTTFNADDDDIWILKCPTEISINDFKDFNLVLDGKSKLKINGQTYDGNIDESDCKLPIVTYSKKKAFLKNLSVLKTITFRKRIPVPHIQDDSIITSSQTNFIPLPDTKCRHPLFGLNYKKAIKISKLVLERLAESSVALQPELEEDIYKKKRKKHKKEKNIEKVCKVEHVKEEPEGQSIPEESPIKKKKRKHKIKEESDIKPSKRIKLEQNPEAWESEKAIEENLFNF